MPKQNNKSMFQSKSSNTTEKILFEKILCDDPFNGFNRKIIFRLRQVIYPKQYGNKKVEYKYNKIDLIGEKDGSPLTTTLSQEGFVWLNNVMTKESAIKDALFGKSMDETNFSERFTEQGNFERYYSYTWVNNWLSQLTLSDGFKSFGLCFSENILAELKDLYSKIIYLLT